MTSPVTYRLSDNVAMIGMDDGKVNCVNQPLLTALEEALVRAEQEAQAVVWTGRPGMFSGGFDLKVFQQGIEPAKQLTAAGNRFLIRLLSTPLPLVIASSGHAVAMGAFLLLTGDLRIGVEGQYKYWLNEVAIGITMPHFALALTQDRLSPRYQTRAVLTAEPFSPADACSAGFLDHVVAADALEETAVAHAKRLATLNGDAFAATKARLRGPVLTWLRTALEQEFA